jgi:hypothetical protein
MVESRPVTGRSGGIIHDPIDSRPAGQPQPRSIVPLPQRGMPGNRWPTARQLAALIVNGLLRIPERYRRGMYLDILI